MYNSLEHGNLKLKFKKIDLYLFYMINEMKNYLLYTQLN